MLYIAFFFFVPFELIFDHFFGAQHDYNFRNIAKMFDLNSNVKKSSNMKCKTCGVQNPDIILYFTSDDLSTFKLVCSTRKNNFRRMKPWSKTLTIVILKVFVQNLDCPKP